jgi:hypothetical protein
LKTKQFLTSKTVRKASESKIKISCFKFAGCNQIVPHLSKRKDSLSFKARCVLSALPALFSLQEDDLLGASLQKTPSEVIPLFFGLGSGEQKHWNPEQEEAWLWRVIALLKGIAAKC